MSKIQNNINSNDDIVSKIKIQTKGLNENVHVNNVMREVIKVK